ncbi:MAG: DMT family transporter [Reichenbachiella sp.]
MPNKNILLYIVPALIWGSTWYVITFQIGLVDPLVSVVYRYVLAGAMMMGYCVVKGVNMRFSLHQHFFMILQGMFLFGFNYWMAYEAETHITSGLMAVAFSTIVFANSILGYFLMGKPINKGVMIGAVMGLSGTVMIFSKEFLSMNVSDEVMLGAGIAMFSVFLASLGNIASARNTGGGIPVVQANAYGMVYGAVMMAIVAWVLDKPFVFDTSKEYVLSLIFLAIFGSIIAFGFYLTLVGKIGADKAAYALVIIPVISITISSVFEDYQMSWMTVVGVSLIIAGNVFALRKRKPVLAN